MEKGVYVAANVGLITANHDPYNLDMHIQAAEVVFDDGCWIGMNSVVLPDVRLGPKTIVAAGAVGSRSYPEGYVVLSGVPARPIRNL